jgi:hypothetical protein
VKPLSLIVLGLLPVASIGQNYQPVASQHVRFFDRNEPEDFDEYGLRIDSVTTNGTDSTYYNYLASRDYAGFGDNGDCRFKRYSWIGTPVTVKANGWTFFVNEVQDTVKIHHEALLNDTWPALHLSSDSIVWATVTDISAQTVLGISDNVKTISFTMKDASNATLTHHINGSTMQIGETLGLVKSFDLYHFPNYLEAWFHDNISLTGAEDLNAGIRRPKIELLFEEFQIGDEFAFRTRVNYHDPAIWNAEVYDTLIQIIDKQSQPELQYTLAVHTSSRTYFVDQNLGPTFVNQYSSFTTIATDHRFYPFYEHHSWMNMPSEMYERAMIDKSFNNAYEYINDTLKMNVFSTVFGDLQPNGCIDDGVFESVPWNIQFKEHLGAVWAWWYWAYDDTNFSLRYLKRGSNIYGLPVSVSDIQGVHQTPSLSLHFYPNPVQRVDPLHLSSNFKQVEIFDLSGKLMITEQNASTIQLDNMRVGVYLIRLTSESGVSTQKLVVTD